MSASNGVSQYYPMVLEETPPEEEWADLNWPEMKPGYLINRSGSILSPSGQPLKPGPRGSSEILWVTIPSTDSDRKSGLSLRVDKLVLHTFVGDPGPHQLPIHINDDQTDNRVENLKWGRFDDLPAHRRRGRGNDGTPKKPRKKKAVKRATATPRTPSGGIEVLRVYRDGKMQITVDQDGTAKLPKMTYTADEFATLLGLAERAVEMNRLMKL